MGASMMGRAREKGILQLAVHDLREHGLGRHRQVDDTPYGGGQGMLLRPEPLFGALRAVHAPGARVLLMSPAGKPFAQAAAQRLAGEEHLIFVSGHYEGVDQRVVDRWVDEEISIGDYVLSGGEPAALVLLDACVRLLPGVMGAAESAVEESHSAGLLEYPHYTRPPEFRGWKVPDVLLSGNHKEISDWRHRQSILRTARRRPDLLGKAELTDTDLNLVKSTDLNNN